jgi:hypothetical protein
MTPPPPPSPPTHDARAAWEERWAEKRPLVELGLRDLALWLDDTLELGAAQLLHAGPKGPLDLAARMMNVECRGISKRLERLAALLGDDGRTGGDRYATTARPGETHTLEPLERVSLALGELWLLASAGARVDALTFEARVSLLTEVGLSEPPKEVRLKPPVEGQWVALAVTTEREGGLRERRTWLARLAAVGQRPSAAGLSGWGLCLDYAFGPSPLPPQLARGERVSPHLRPFEGVAPRRLLPSPTEGLPTSEGERPVILGAGRLLPEEWARLPWADDLSQALDWRAEALARAPWRDRTPLVARDITLSSPAAAPEDAPLWAVDARGDALPLTPPPLSERRRLLAAGAEGGCYLLAESTVSGHSPACLVTHRGEVVYV